MIWLNRFITRFRMHEFKRIEDATIQPGVWMAYRIPRYECQKCGERLHLDPWQMESLPPVMKYNCPGH